MAEMVANSTLGKSMLYAVAAWMKGSDTVGALLIINSLCSSCKKKLFNCKTAVIPRTKHKLKCDV